MTADKDLRDNTRALNNLADQMATFNKVAKELNKNLTILAKAKEMQIGPTRFQEYLKNTTCAVCVLQNCGPVGYKTDDCECCAMNHAKFPGE
jgi:hypothetical protein